MFKQVFATYFEPVVTHFGPNKILKRLENEPFLDQNRVQKRS